MEKHFWLDGKYYRFYNDQWQLSMTLDSGWVEIGDEKLPPGLRNKYKGKQISKNNPGLGWGRGKNK